MKNILLINTNCSINKGSAAQVISTKETLESLISPSNFILSSHYPELDFKLCNEHNVKIFALINTNFPSGFFRLLLGRTRLLFCLFRCLLWSMLCKVGLNAKGLINEELLKIYSESDLIIDLSGDTLSDKYVCSLFSILNILIGILLKKKIVIFSQSIGPFRRITIPLARFCLNKADLIIIREKITKSYLERINIHNHLIHLGADIAFLLKPAPRKTVQEIFLKEKINVNRTKYPIIGIGTSARIYRILGLNKAIYLELMAKTADFLVEKLNAQVILVPHVIIPDKYEQQDDRFVAEKIHYLARNKNRIKIIKNDYSPEELKGIIGRCKLFIGSRMHSNIASTSMYVPTIALSWSHKYRGIMKMMGQEKYVCDIKTITFDELILKINDAWNNRAELKNHLQLSIRMMEKSALFTCRLVSDLVNLTK